MLHHLRAGATHQVVKIFLILIIASFVLWGVGDMLKLRGNHSFATIDGKKHISAVEFDKAYRQTLRSMMEQEGHMPSLEEIQQHAVRERVLNRLVHQRLIQLWQKKSGIEVGDASVIDALERSSVYHDAQGKFDKEKFYTLLSVNNLQEAEFISMLRDEIAQQMVLGALQEGTAVMPTMVDTIIRYGRSPRTVSVIKLDNSSKQVQFPKSEDLEAYYRQHAAEFMIPEKRVLTVVTLPLEKLLPTLSASETAELLAEAGVKEKDAKAAEIIAEWRTRKAVQHMHQKITHIEDAFAAGDTPKQLAAEFPVTLWHGSALQGAVDQLRQQLPKHLIAEANDILIRAYETEESNASNMMITEDGRQAYAVWVEKVTPAQTLPYAVVANKVETAWKHFQQKEALKEQAEAIKREALTQKSLTKAAALANLSSPQIVTYHYSNMPKATVMPAILAQTLIESSPGTCVIHSEGLNQWVGCLNKVTWYQGEIPMMELDALKQQLLQQQDHMQLEALIQHLYRHYQVKLHPNFIIEEVMQ